MAVQGVKIFAMIKFRALAHHVFVYFRVKKYVKSEANEYEIPVWQQEVLGTNKRPSGSRKKVLGTMKRNS